MGIELAASPIWRLVSRKASPLVTCRVGTGMPFYCIHPVAGDIAVYEKLFELISKEQTIIGIQVPAVRMKAGGVESVNALARYYADTIAAHQPEGPLMLGGYSAGAIIALEVAQCMREIGRDVSLLVVLDGLPLNSGAEIKPWRLAYIARLAKNFPHWLLSRRAADWTVKGIKRRLLNRMVFRSSGLGASAVKGPARQHVETVAGVVGRAGWKPDHVAFIRALYDGLHSYVPCAYSGRVIVFTAKITSPWEISQTSQVWSALAPGCVCEELYTHHAHMLEGGAATQSIARVLNNIFGELRGSTS